MFFEFVNRIKYWRNEDRISPENPLNHWRLYFRSSMIKICQKKFKHFGKDFRNEINPALAIININGSTGKRYRAPPTGLAKKAI